MSMPGEVLSEPISKQCLRVWLKLLKANGSIESVLRRNLREVHESTLPRFDVMSALSRHPRGLKMSEISNFLRMSNGNVTTIVDRLAEEELVERKRTPVDRRAVEILLTEKGHRAFKVQAADHEAWVENLLSGIGGHALGSIDIMLDQMNNHLETVGGAKQ